MRIISPLYAFFASSFVKCVFAIENLSDFELSCVVAAARIELEALSRSSPRLISGDSSNVTFRFCLIFYGETGSLPG